MGLEPIRLSSADFESAASTNFTTLAFGGEGGIRTHARFYSPRSFQDYSLQPLEYPSRYLQLSSSWHCRCISIYLIGFKTRQLNIGFPVEAGVRPLLFGLSSPLKILPIALGTGAGRRTRTPDLLITNQLLYRLSYTSILCPVY